MRYILHRAVHHLAGRFGEFIIASGLAVVVALGFARIDPPAWFTGSVHASVLVAVAAFALLLLGLSLGRMSGGDQASPNPVADGMGWSIPGYPTDAPTFVHYSHETKVSLTRNIRLLVTDGSRDFTFYFLQPIVTETTVVRPFGGTPRFDIVSCSEGHLHIRLAEKTDVLKLAILGQIMPVIQNHPDAPVPFLGVRGRIGNAQPFEPAPADRRLEDGLP